MIAVLEGKVSEKIGETVVLDIGGVGYGLLVSFEDFGALNVGDTAKLYVHESIRETAHDLFGFRTKESKVLFELLLSVKGVGPKMALAILSVASIAQVRQAIASGDTKFISQAKGIGRKAAERVVVELKDKVGLMASEDATEFLTSSGEAGDEAMQGLVALGFSVQDAADALRGVDKELPAPDRIKQALKNR